MQFATILALLTGILIIAATFFLMTRNRRTMIRVCLALFTLTFVCGFLIYTFSYMETGRSAYDSLYGALRGIYSTGRMFAINDDRSELSAISSRGLFGIDIRYTEIILWFCHVIALIVVQTAIIYLVAKKLSDRLRLSFGSHGVVYVIVGDDRKALMLGENIATGDKPNQLARTDRLVLFLLNQEDDAEKIANNISHFGGILLVMNQSNTLIDCLRRAGLGKRTIIKRRYKVILYQNNGVLAEDVRGIAQYSKSKGIKQENLEIYAFTSSDWDREEIKKISMETEEIYAFTSYDSDREEIEENSKETDKNDTAPVTRRFPYIIHLLNEADISARLMVKKHSPYICLHRNNAFSEGRSQKDFTVMILGFGETSQHALLSLIRNGQFAGSSMRAIIVDRELEETDLYSRFQNSFPSIPLCCEIKESNRLSINVFSKEFYDVLKQTDESVDYIVISLGNEEDNKKAALELHRYYLRFHEDAPFIAVYSEEGNFQNDNIFSFGQLSDVYTESLIINGEIDLLAKELSSGYNRGQFKRDARIEWHELGWFSQESKRAQVDFLPVVLQLASFDDVKVKLLESLGEVLYSIDKSKVQLKMANSDGLRQTIKENLDADKARADSIKEKLDLSETFKETFAEMEHLRWNAFHATMGYCPISIPDMWIRYDRFKDRGDRERRNLCRKDETARLHLCLTSWDDLDECYEEYLKINPKYKDFKEMDYEGVFDNIAKYLYNTSKNTHL